MPHANRPAGPGTPKAEQRDAVVQQEGLDELLSPDDAADDTAPHPDPTTSARHAERAAHTKNVGENKRR